MNRSLTLAVAVGPKIGGGHLVRQLALAQWMQAHGWQIRFWLPIDDAWAAKKILATGHDFILLLQADLPPPARPDEWMLFDGECFGREAFLEAASLGFRVALFDDEGRTGLVPELVINPNPHATADMYPSLAAGSRVLLGPRYVLLREEVRQASEVEGRNQNIVVTFGASDPLGLTVPIVRILQSMELACSVVVVLGGLVKARSLIKQEVLSVLPGASVLEDVANMGQVLRDARLVISAAGSTSWEVAALGRPAVLTPVASNQRPIAIAASARGAAICVEPKASEEEWRAAISPLLRSSKKLSALGARARNWIDGRGVERLTKELEVPRLQCRAVTPADMRTVFEWANDPEVRRQSFSSDPIAWSDHKTWFDQQLASSKTRFWIVGDQTRELGVVRFVKMCNTWEISVNANPNFRGQGAGAALIACGTRALMEVGEELPVLARIKPSNTASVRAFERSGYLPVEESADDEIILNFAPPTIGI